MKRDASKVPRHSHLTAADYRSLAAFRFAVRRYLAFADAGAKSVGLTGQQHQALLAIKGQSAKAMSIGELAAQLLIRHHSAVELVGRLEKAGFTKRSTDNEDRRKVLVSLTEAGEAVMSALSAKNLRELRLIAPAFSNLLEQLERLNAD